MADREEGRLGSTHSLLLAFRKAKTNQRGFLRGRTPPASNRKRRGGADTTPAPLFAGERGRDSPDVTASGGGRGGGGVRACAAPRDSASGECRRRRDRSCRDRVDGAGRRPRSRPVGCQRVPLGGPPPRCGCDINVPLGVGGRGSCPPRCESQRIRGAAGKGLTRNAGEEGVNNPRPPQCNFVTSRPNSPPAP